MVDDPPLELLQGQHQARRRMDSSTPMVRQLLYCQSTNESIHHHAATPVENLLRKFIYLNITTIADIVTACRQFITKEAYAGAKSYESIHKWPHQQHFFSNTHSELWTNCMSNITRQGSRQLRQPMGAWTAAPTTIRPYRMAGDKLLVQQKDGSWLQLDQCIHQQQTRSTHIHFEGLGGNPLSSPVSIE